MTGSPPPAGAEAAGPPVAVEGLPRAGRCLVMGVVNVTPDSFSDGGRFQRPDQAVAHGLRLAAEGADLVDVGGESTRPGAARTSDEEERARVLPVVAGLVDAGVPVSVDTMRAEVAAAAVAAGARLVNDVSGGRADPRMHRVVAGLGVPYVLMHWRGHAASMDRLTTYDGPGGVLGGVVRELAEQLRAAVGAGLDPERIAVDPGIGFAKTPEQSWEVLAGLDRLHVLGRPVLVGASRKRFLGTLLAEGGDPGQPRPPEGRDAATAATTALAAAGGAWCVRVHAVAASADAVRVAARWRAAGRVEAR